jgi:hypothetical protein
VVRVKTRKAIRDEQPTAAWPLLADSRTLADVRSTAQGLEHRRKERKLQADERARRRRLDKLARDPQQAFKRKYAGRNQLISVLRKAGLLDK